MNEQDWHQTEQVTPLPNREVLARNTNKEFPAEKAAKQYQVKKYIGTMLPQGIKEALIGSGLNEWCYL